MSTSVFYHRLFAGSLVLLLCVALTMAVPPFYSSEKFKRTSMSECESTHAARICYDCARKFEGSVMYILNACCSNQSESQRYTRDYCFRTHITSPRRIAGFNDD